MAADQGLYVYDFTHWVLNVNGRIYNDVDTVDWQPSGPQASMQTGSRGTGTIIKDNMRSGTVVITAKQSHAIHSQLSQLADDQFEAANGLPVAVTFTNTQTGERYFCANSVLENRGGTSYSKEPGDQSWTLLCTHYTHTPGLGAVEIVPTL